MVRNLEDYFLYSWTHIIKFLRNYTQNKICIYVLRAFFCVLNKTTRENKRPLSAREKNRSCHSDIWSIFIIKALLYFDSPSSFLQLIWNGGLNLKDPFVQGSM